MSGSTLLNSSPVLTAAVSVMLVQGGCGHHVRRNNEHTADASPAGSTTSSEGTEARQSAVGTDLSIALEGPLSARKGERIALTIKVTNHGPKVPAQYIADVELTEHLTFRTSSKNCQEYRPPGGLSCTISGVEVGATFEATLGVDVTARPPTDLVEIKANVKISPDNIRDIAPANNSAQLRVVITP